MLSYNWVEAKRTVDPVVRLYLCWMAIAAESLVKDDKALYHTLIQWLNLDNEAEESTEDAVKELAEFALTLLNDRLEAMEKGGVAGVDDE